MHKSNLERKKNQTLVKIQNKMAFKFTKKITVLVGFVFSMQTNRKITRTKSSIPYFVLKKSTTMICLLLN